MSLSLQLDARLDGYVEQNEFLEARVAELTSQVALGQADVESLQMALQQREVRVDELMKEQDRDEDEVYAKVGLIERLRKRLEESERVRAEVERRYQDQVSWVHRRSETRLIPPSAPSTPSTPDDDGRQGEASISGHGEPASEAKVQGVYRA